MTEPRDDDERRRRAIELHADGAGLRAIAERLGRSRGWVAKWLHRFRAEGWKGLRSRSRAPKGQARQMPARIVALVVAIRDGLERRQTRRTRFSGCGGEVVRVELQRRRVRPLPSLTTIERILRRQGYPKRPAPRRRGGGEPYPAPRLQRAGDLHQTDLVGPRYLRGPNGITRFYSVHTIAVVGRGVATSQGRHKTAERLCEHFVQAWQWLGVPAVSQMDNEMAATGGGRYPYSLSLVMRLHLLVGSRLLFIPPGEPGRNASIESFNGLWQERVLCHPCADLRALRRTDRAFLRSDHFQKPHRALRRVEVGTRYPGEWLARQGPQLRRLPASFSLAAYRGPQGTLHLPVARGRISFIRRVDTTGAIEINGMSYPLRRSLVGQYVTATLYTHRQVLVVRALSRYHKRFPFPIAEPLIDPLFPLPRGRL